MFCKFLVILLFSVPAWATFINPPVPISKGGTGQTTATAALNALLPSQTGQSGNCLGTNGSNSSWTTCGGGGSSVGNATQVEFLEQRCEKEHYNIFSDPLDNSVATGFVQQPANYTVNGVLLDTLSSGGSSMAVIWAPLYLSSSDKNTDSTTSWVAEGNAGSLTTSVTAKVGSNSLSFAKTSGGTSATIKYDSGSAIQNVNGFTTLWFWINIPSLVNFTDVKVIIDIDATNFATYTASTNYAGSALTTGWNLMKFDLSAAGTNSGTGWTSTQAFRYFHVGIDAGSTQTYSGILIDAIYFEIANPANYIPLGSEVAIYDNTNRENLTIASSNSTVDGGAVTLVSTIGHTYTPGFGSSDAVLARSTLSFGNNQAAMVTTDQFSNTLAGNSRLTQEARLARALRSALSSATLNAFAEVNTSQVYKVVSTTSTTIVVSDSTNDSADLLSGEVVHVFQTIYEDGKANFVYRGDMTLSTNSSNTSSQTTLTCTGASCVPTGTTAGDYVVKKIVTASYSAAATNANESYSTLSTVASPDGVLLTDNGLPIPNLSNLWGYWSLGGASTSVAAKALAGQSGTNLTLSGTLTPNFSFFDGFGTTGWSTANAFFMASSDASAVDSPSTLAVSFWIYPTSSLSGDAFVIGKTNTSTNGWDVYMHSAATQVAFQVNGANSIGPTGTYVNNQWNHIYVDYQKGVTNGTHLYLNGSLLGSATTTESATSGNNLVLGSANQSTNAIASNVGLAQLMIWTGATLSSAQVSQIYNQGKARIMGFGPMLKYRYQATGVSGQKVALKTQLARDTVNVMPFLRKVGIIK